MKKQKKTKKQNNENKITTINDYKTYEEFKQTVESSKDGDTVKLTENRFILTICLLSTIDCVLLYSNPGRILEISIWI